MNTLDDLRSLKDSSYGVQYVHGRFSAEQNVNFYQSEKEWLSMRDTCDERLKKYQISDQRQPASFFERPVLHQLRQTYAPSLEKRPETIEECRSAIASLMITINTIASLERVVPFSSTSTDLRSANHLKVLKPQDKHLTVGTPSMVNLEKSTIAAWNARRSATGLPELDPWSLKTFSSVLARDNVVAGRIHPNGEMRTLGHFFMRTAGDEQQRGYELIDFAAEAGSGANDALIILMLNEMKASNRLRLTSVLEETHPHLEI